MGGLAIAPRPFHRPFHFAAGFSLLDGFPTVMLLLALGQPEFDLGKAPLGEIDAERDKREPLLLSLAQELIDLLTVEKQFSSTERFVIHDIAVAVWTDVAVVKKCLATFHAGVTVLEVHAALSNGFDLSPLEHDSSLELFFDEIVVIGLAIRDDHLCKAFLLFSHSASDFHVQKYVLSAYRSK